MEITKKEANRVSDMIACFGCERYQIRNDGMNGNLINAKESNRWETVRVRESVCVAFQFREWLAFLIGMRAAGAVVAVFSDRFLFFCCCAAVSKNDMAIWASWNWDQNNMGLILWMTTIDGHTSHTKKTDSLFMLCRCSFFFSFGYKTIEIQCSVFDLLNCLALALALSCLFHWHFFSIFSFFVSMYKYFWRWYIFNSLKIFAISATSTWLK